jgi:hypothetical protein
MAEASIQVLLGGGVLLCLFGGSFRRLPYPEIYVAPILVCVVSKALQPFGFLQLCRRIGLAAIWDHCSRSKSEDHKAANRDRVHAETPVLSHLRSADGTIVSDLRTVQMLKCAAFAHSPHLGVYSPGEYSDAWNGKHRTESADRPLELISLASADRESPKVANQDQSKRQDPPAHHRFS